MWFRSELVPCESRFTGHYMFVEATKGNKGDRAILKSPFERVVDNGTICVHFYVHMYGDNIGSLHVRGDWWFFGKGLQYYDGWIWKDGWMDGIDGWFDGWCMDDMLTHWGRVTHICVSELPIIGSDNGLSPGRRQAIIWTNAVILLIRTLRTNLNEILSEIHTFSFKKMYLKMSSGKRWPFCLGLKVLIQGSTNLMVAALVGS